MASARSSSRSPLPRALFLTQFFPPETFAGANRAYALARALAATFELTVVGLHPAYPDSECYDAAATAHFDSRVGFTLHRRFSFTPHRHPSWLARAMREQAAALVLGARAVFAPGDIVVTSSPSMFLGPVALLIARVKRAAFVWDVRDITWAVAVESKSGTGVLVGALAALLDRVMWLTARRCDLLVAATPGIAELAEHAGVAPDRIVTVENGITDQLRMSLADARNHPRTQRPVVTYVGLLGQAQQLRTLVEAAQQLPDVDFLIVGEGPQRAALEEHIHRTDSSNVQMLGYVKPEQLPKVLGGSDLMFAQVVDSPTLNQTARPSKLLEYMAAGRPVVYAGHGSAAELIERVGCGVCVAPGDSSGVAAAIRSLLEDRGALDELGARGSAYVDALPSRDARMHVLTEIVRQRFSASGEK